MTVSWICCQREIIAKLYVPYIFLTCTPPNNCEIKFVWVVFSSVSMETVMQTVSPFTQEAFVYLTYLYSQISLCCLSQNIRSCRGPGDTGCPPCLQRMRPDDKRSKVKAIQSRKHGLSGRHFSPPDLHQHAGRGRPYVKLVTVPDRMKDRGQRAFFSLFLLGGH